MSDAGYKRRMMAEHNSTAPTVNSGELVDLQADENGNLKVSAIDKVNSLAYQAAADTDVVVSDAPARLVGILIGADVASSVVEISDSADDGDGDVKIYLAGDTLSGYYPVDVDFSVGIAADITNQTHITFIYR
jgi:hypothetical protein